MNNPKVQFQVNSGAGWQTIAEADIIDGIAEPPNAWTMVRALGKRIVYTGGISEKVTVTPSDPREAHFAGFAEKLFAELAANASKFRDFPYPIFRQRQREIIARRAYDLVAHTIENTAHIDLDRLSIEEHVLRIPDLAELPKEESE